MYLISLNCTLKNGSDSQCYVICILIQCFKLEKMSVRETVTEGQPLYDSTLYETPGVETESRMMFAKG